MAAAGGLPFPDYSKCNKMACDSDKGGVVKNRGRSKGPRAQALRRSDPACGWRTGVGWALRRVTPCELPWQAASRDGIPDGLRSRMLAIRSNAVREGRIAIRIPRPR